MGWTSVEKPLNVKTYMDQMFTCVGTTSEYVVLKSAIVNFKEYYAAVAKLDLSGTVQKVFAIVCLLQYHANEFLYKDMDETSFPYYFNPNNR